MGNPSTASTTYAIEDHSVRRDPAIDLDPARLEFGRVFCPNMFAVDYAGGTWTRPRLEPVQPLSMHPGAVGLHYGQCIFEGLKAFRHANGKVALFRPDAHASRLNVSATILDMPSLPVELFEQACHGVVAANRTWVPHAPGSLYIRPAMVATEPCLGVRSSREYAFFILGLPTGSYFPDTPVGAGSIRVLVSESSFRAAPGGTGSAKAAGNYAATLRITTAAKKMGCGQVLFLNATDRRSVEEMGGMNIFFVRDGALLTPPLSDTILRGIMRDTILTCASRLGIRVHERPLDIRDILAGIRDGSVTEAIASGTAAALTGINAFVLESGEQVRFPSEAPGPITTRLYNHIRSIQNGQSEDPHGWLHYVDDDDRR
jgi:branched-chain amino acid aminotransferase